MLKTTLLTRSAQTHPSPVNRFDCLLYTLSIQSTMCSSWKMSDGIHLSRISSLLSQTLQTLRHSSVRSASSSARIWPGFTIGASKSPQMVLVKMCYPCSAIIWSQRMCVLRGRLVGCWPPPSSLESNGVREKRLFRLFKRRSRKTKRLLIWGTFGAWVGIPSRSARH